MLKTPIWITNFKNYENSTGAHAVELAKIHDRVTQHTGKSIAIAVNPADVYRVAQAVSIPVLSQHVDGFEFGKYSGWISPQVIKKSHGVGTLLNHSEHLLSMEDLQSALSCSQQASLVRIVCAENPEMVEKIANLEPDFIAFEPPELIGCTSGESVATAHPQSIVNSVKMSRGIPLIVGAGINSPQDVEVSLKLGAKGFLVATAIVKAQDPEKALTEFVSAF